MTPERIQLKRVKGWRLPPNTVVVSRPTKSGNPFSVDPDVPSGTKLEKCTAAPTIEDVVAELLPRRPHTTYRVSLTIHFSRAP